MSESWVERQGGIWMAAPPAPSHLIAERFDPALQAFQLIWQRDSDGHFQVEFLIKDEAARNPQWSLPFWTDIAQGGIFESLSAAEAHLVAVSNNRRAVVQ